jgi:hypothetical protein
MIVVRFFYPLLDWHGVPCLKLKELSFSSLLMGANPWFEINPGNY